MKKICEYCKKGMNVKNSRIKYHNKCVKIVAKKRNKKQQEKICTKCGKICTGTLCMKCVKRIGTKLSKRKNRKYKSR